MLHFVMRSSTHEDKLRATAAEHSSASLKGPEHRCTDPFLGNRTTRNSVAQARNNNRNVTSKRPDLDNGQTYHRGICPE